MLLKFTEGSYYLRIRIIDIDIHIFSTEENLGYPGIHVTSLQNLKLFYGSVSVTLQMFTGVYRVIKGFFCNICRETLQSVNITGFSLQILQKNSLITL